MLGEQLSEVLTQIGQDVGDLAQLETEEKRSLVQAINWLTQQQQGNANLPEMVRQLVKQGTYYD